MLNLINNQLINCTGTNSSNFTMILNFITQNRIHFKTRKKRVFLGFFSQLPETRVFNFYPELETLSTSTSHHRSFPNRGRWVWCVNIETASTRTQTIPDASKKDVTSRNQIHATKKRRGRMLCDYSFSVRWFTHAYPTLWLEGTKRQVPVRAETHSAHASTVVLVVYNTTSFLGPKFFCCE